MYQTSSAIDLSPNPQSDRHVFHRLGVPVLCLVITFGMLLEFTVFSFLFYVDAKL